MTREQFARHLLVVLSHPNAVLERRLGLHALIGVGEGARYEYEIRVSLLLSSEEIDRLDDALRALLAGGPVPDDLLQADRQGDDQG